VTLLDDYRPVSVIRGAGVTRERGPVWPEENGDDCAVGGTTTGARRRNLTTPAAAVTVAGVLTDQRRAISGRAIFVLASVLDGKLAGRTASVGAQPG